MKKTAFLILVVVLFSLLAMRTAAGRTIDRPQHRFLPLDSKVILVIDFSPSASEVTETIFTCIQETDGLFCKPIIQDP